MLVKMIANGFNSESVTGVKILTPVLFPYSIYYTKYVNKLKPNGVNFS